MSRCIRRSVEQMEGYVPGEQPAGSSILKLNTNENPYPPSPRVMEALRTIGEQALVRYPPPRAAQLRRRIAALHGCDMKNIFAGNGSDEVLALCTRAFVEDDQTIGAFEPSYSLYPVLARIRNVEMVSVPLGQGFEWNSPRDCGAALYFLTNPNAPTGVFYPKEKICEFCGAFDGLVVIDEAYVDFAADNCLDIALELENVLVVRTLSKSYSLAGLRVGYCAGSATLIEALDKIKDSYNLDAVSQVLAEAALDDVAYMRANAFLVRRTRQRLEEQLKRLGFNVIASQANFAWVSPPEPIGADELFEDLRQVNILVRHFPGARTGSFLRITIGTDEQTDTLLDAVRIILKRKQAPHEDANSRDQSGNT